MTFPNGGQRDEGNPNRMASRSAFDNISQGAGTPATYAPSWSVDSAGTRGPVAHYFQNASETSQAGAAATGSGGPWQRGFVGTYMGKQDNNHYFSADATGGGSSDSLQIPDTAWGRGDKSMVGQRMAILPSAAGSDVSDVREGAHAMPLTADNERNYSHLPGFKR
jgi:hypothetical protein